MAGFVDWLMDFLYAFALIAVGWLPDSPFQTGEIAEALNKFKDIMSYINYFIPIGWMVNIMTAYIAAVAIWYIARWVLRLAQFID